MDTYDLLIAAGFVFLVTLGVTSAEPMFSIANRPQVFRGPFGNLVFGVDTSLITLAGLAGLVWSFASLPWYVALGIWLVGPFLSALICHILPVAITQSAFGPIIAASALVVLSRFAWSSW